MRPILQRALSRAQQQYQVALLAAWGDNPIDIDVLIKEKGLAFALRVLEARRKNGTNIFRQKL